MKLAAALTLGLSLVAAPAMATTISIFTIGSNPAGNARDPLNNPIGGVPIITWTQTVAAGPIPTTYLTIMAEGVDGGAGAPGGGEHDQVFVNGTAVGFLTQQSFFTPLFNLQPGPGALAGITAETLSVFDVTSLLVNGVNTFSVHVDPSNWVNEVETASLDAVPEPATLTLLGVGLAGIAARRRRNRQS